jgi:hypothetical protein
VLPRVQNPTRRISFDKRNVMLDRELGHFKSSVRLLQTLQLLFVAAFRVPLEPESEVLPLSPRSRLFHKGLAAAGCIGAYVRTYAGYLIFNER